MKKGYAEDYPGSKVYFTKADFSAQALYALTPEEFDFKIKLWLIFTDHVIVSVGHMLYSTLTFKWLVDRADEVSELADMLALLPSLREDRDGFKEFVLKHPKEKDRSQLHKIPKDILLERAAILSDMFTNAISWPPMGESHWFRDTIVKDLTQKESPLRKRMIGIPSSAVDALTHSIETCAFFNREKLIELVRVHCPQRKNLLTRYGDILYYFSGAVFKDAFPHSSSRGDLSFFGEGFLCRRAGRLRIS